MIASGECNVEGVFVCLFHKIVLFYPFGSVMLKVEKGKEGEGEGETRKQQIVCFIK